MNRSHERMKDAAATEYVDVKFESLVHDIEKMTLALKDKDRKLGSTEKMEQLKEICRAIRATKLHFYKVLERYGAQYEDSARHFVDLAYNAADLACGTDSEELKESLRRHAEEADKARTATIAAG